nr:hypothetical protein [Angustibacter aerolatus]
MRLHARLSGLRVVRRLVPSPEGRHGRPRRHDDPRDGQPRQAPAHPLRRRPHPAHPPAHGRRVDGARPRQAPAAPPRPGRARAARHRSGRPDGHRPAAAGGRGATDPRRGRRRGPPRPGPAR